MIIAVLSKRHNSLKSLASPIPGTIKTLHTFHFSENPSIKTSTKQNTNKKFFTPAKLYNQVFSLDNPRHNTIRTLNLTVSNIRNPQENPPQTIAEELEGSIKRNSIGDALGAYQRYIDEVGIPGKDLMTMYLNLLSHKGGLAKASQVVDYVVQQTSNPREHLDREALQNLCLRFARTNMPVPTTALLRAMVAMEEYPRVEFWSEVISHMGNTPAGTCQLFEVMKEFSMPFKSKGVDVGGTKNTKLFEMKPDTAAFNIALKSCLLHRLNGKAEFLCKIMTELNVPWDSVTYGMLSQIYERSGRINELMKLKVGMDRDVVDGHVYSQYYHSILTCHFKSGDLDSAAGVIVEMINRAKAAQRSFEEGTSVKDCTDKGVTSSFQVQDDSWPNIVNPYARKVEDGNDSSVTSNFLVQDDLWSYIDNSCPEGVKAGTDSSVTSSFQLQGDYQPNVENSHSSHVKDEFQSHFQNSPFDVSKGLMGNLDFGKGYKNNYSSVSSSVQAQDDFRRNIDISHSRSLQEEFRPHFDNPPFDLSKGLMGNLDVSKGYKNDDKMYLVSCTSGVAMPNVNAFGKLIKGFLEANRIMDLADFLVKVHRLQDPAAIEFFVDIQVIKACIQFEWLDEARDLIYEMKIAGIRVGSEVYNSILKAYSKAKLFREAKSFLKQARTEGVALDTDCYDALIALYASQKHLKDAFDLFTEMRRVKSSTSGESYQVLMEGFEKENKPKLMIRLLEELKDDQGTCAAVHEWNSTIHYLCKKRLLGDAEKSFRKMIDLGYLPNAQTFHILVHAYSFKGDMAKDIAFLWEELIKIENQRELKMNSSLKLDAELLDTFLYSFIRAGFFSKALEVGRIMENHGMVVNKFRYREVYLMYHRTLYRNKKAPLNQSRRRMQRRKEVAEVKNWLELPRN